jgi:amino acid transporter
MPQDAGRTVPTAMVGSYLLSGVLSVIFLISYLFVIVDIEGAVNHPTGYPFLYVFTQAFSMEAVNALTAIVTCLIFAGTLSYNLSSSRQVWAVSHDSHDYIEVVLICFSLPETKDCPFRTGSRKWTPHSRFLAMLSS